MTTGPATAGRNLVGAVGVVGVAVLLYLALSPGATHTWLIGHPGVLGAALVALGVAAAVAFASGRGGAALMVALVVFTLAYAPHSVRVRVAAGERVVLGTGQGVRR